MMTAISQSVGMLRQSQYDFLYENYTSYLESFGFKLVKISNFSKDIASYFDKYKIKRVILSGGNSVSPKLYGSRTKIDDVSNERDTTEAELLRVAIKRRIPVLGICRGMQFINVFFGGKLKKVVGHVRSGHSVNILKGDTIKVNSYHNYGLTEKELACNLKIFAVADKVVEGLYHLQYPIAGIQWHPERAGGDKKFNQEMMNIFYRRTLFWK